MPPRAELWGLTEPETLATTGVPRGAMMSFPWWRRPPERGWPQSFENARGPCTGQIQLPEAMTPVGPPLGAEAGVAAAARDAAFGFARLAAAARSAARL